MWLHSNHVNGHMIFPEDGAFDVVGGGEYQVHIKNKRVIDLTDSPSPKKRCSKGPSEGPSEAAATTGGSSQADTTTGQAAATTGGPSELACTSDESTTSSEFFEADSDHLCIVCKEEQWHPDLALYVVILYASYATLAL